MSDKSRYLVLVVEDNPVNQKIANLLIRSMGLDTCLANDGKPALDSFKNNSPALVLMDIMMPEMDGFQTSRLIREYEFGSGTHTPIVACTALDEGQVRPEALSCGIDDYLAKPYSRDTLAKKLELWLDLKLERKHISQVAHAFAAAAPTGTALAEPISKERLQILYDLEQLDEILSLFLTVTEALLSQLNKAIQTHSADSVRRIAHEIRSGSHAVDAEELAGICLQIEKAADNWTEAVRTFPALALAFEKVRQFMDKRNASMDLGL